MCYITAHTLFEVISKQYDEQFWTPLFEEDEFKLKLLMRRDSRVIRGSKTLSYKKALEQLG